MRRGLRMLGAAAPAAAALGIGALLAPVQPVAAAPSHVAIVVAGDRSACVPWRAGMTGSDVLATAGFSVGYGQQPPYLGFVLRIDGKGTDRPDNEHYWSYWKDSGSGWTYSSSGAPWAKASPGTVEGWSYVDGQAQAPPPPASSYAAICAGRDPTPAPAATTAHNTASAAGATNDAAPAAGSSGNPPAPPATPTAGTATVDGATARPRPPARTRQPPSRTAGPGSTPATSPAAGGSSSSHLTSAASSSGGSGTPPWGSAAGIGGVATLAGGALWLNRRRRQGAP